MTPFVALTLYWILIRPQPDVIHFKRTLILLLASSTKKMFMSKQEAPPCLRCVILYL